MWTGAGGQLRCICVSSQDLSSQENVFDSGGAWQSVLAAVLGPVTPGRFSEQTTHRPLVWIQLKHLLVLEFNWIRF